MPLRNLLVGLIGAAMAVAGCASTGPKVTGPLVLTLTETTGRHPVHADVALDGRTLFAGRLDAGDVRQFALEELEGPDGQRLQFGRHRLNYLLFRPVTAAGEAELVLRSGQHEILTVNTGNVALGLWRQGRFRFELVEPPSAAESSAEAAPAATSPAQPAASPPPPTRVVAAAPAFTPHPILWGPGPDDGVEPAAPKPGVAPNLAPGVPMPSPAGLDGLHPAQPRLLPVTLKAPTAENIVPGPQDIVEPPKSAEPSFKLVLE